MKKNKIFIYTDASFNNSHSLGYMGFLLFDNVDSHLSSNISSAIVSTMRINELNNIRTEIKSFIWALESLIEIVDNFITSEINIYCDCKTVTNLLLRREKLIKTNFVSKRSGVVLSNSDLYKRYFALYDKLKPNIIWVKGHNKKESMTFIQNNFSYIDRLVRRELRSYISCSF